MSFAHNLTDRITLLKYSAVDDGAGGQTENFSEIADIPAHVTLSSSRGDEARESYLRNRLAIKVILREEHDVQFQDHIRYNNNEYEITTLLPATRRRGYQNIECLQLG